MTNYFLCLLAAADPISIGEWILKGGVPGVLLAGIAYLVKRNGELESSRVDLAKQLVESHEKMTTKVEELLTKQVEATAPVAEALTTSKQSHDRVEDMLRKVEVAMVENTAALKSVLAALEEMRTVLLTLRAQNSG